MKRNLVKDEFAPYMYINIDEYLRLTDGLKKAKKDLDAIQNRLSCVSESKAIYEMGKTLMQGFIDGKENNKLEKLKEGK